MNLLQYSYYDTPDGKDLIPKLIYTTKYATAIGLVASIYDVGLYSHPKTYLETAARVVYITKPVVGMAAAFTAATFLSTQIRKKDDEFNYFVGGVAAGSIFGAWRQSIYTGFRASLFLGIFLMTKKWMVKEGLVYFPDPVGRQFCGVNPDSWDFSIIKDRPHTWTTNPEEA